MQQTYVALLPAHMLLALASPALLSLRVWHGRRGPPWMRWLQPLTDLLLLFSGLTLGWIIQQFPLADAWLTAKLVALVAYVLMGQLAIRVRGGGRARSFAWLIAMTLTAYLFAVSSTQDPLAGI